MKKLDSIRLYREDFDSLTDEEVFGRQFTSNTDCPIARALKRKFPESRVEVMIYLYSIDRQYIETYDIGYGVVNGARERLLGGKKYVTIKLK